VSRIAPPITVTPALLFALVLATIAAPAAAQEARPTLDKIKATGAIAIGYRETSIPFSFVDKEKKPAGYSIDLCLRVAASIQRRLGLKELPVTWVPVTPSSRVPELVRGSIDLECGSTTITFTRMEQVDFSFLTFVDGGSLLATSASKVILRKPGLLTSGERDAVRFVGPIAPATNRGFSGVSAVYLSAASRASRAAATLISKDNASML